MDKTSDKNKNKNDSLIIAQNFPKILLFCGSERKQKKNYRLKPPHKTLVYN